jgi:hypothetical protein
MPRRLTRTIDSGFHRTLTPTAWLKTKDLLLDPENPRLAEYGIKPEAKQGDLLKTLWENMAAEEVAMSIAYNGTAEDITQRAVIPAVGR